MTLVPNGARYCVACSRVYRADEVTCPQDGTNLVLQGSAPGASRIGQVVGNYRLLRIIGEGGVGTVYEAEHTRLGRKMAIKLLHSDVVSKEMVTRFFNEARAVNEIRHPNIIEVEDFVTTPSGEHYMLMEMLVGEDLRTAISNEKRLAPDRVSSIGEQVASALGAVHRVGITHRDLKPDNVFLIRQDGREVAKLLDFGVAKFGNDQQGVTRAGMTMGTPAYMAPEQIITGREKDVGSGSDIYALGMVLYEALTGAPAFQGAATAQILRAHCFEAVEPPSKRRGEPLPAVLEAAVMKCLEKDRAHRFATADDLCEALRSQKPVALSGQIAIVRPAHYEPVRPKSRVVLMLPAFAMAAAALGIQLWPREGAIAATAPEKAAIVKMSAEPPISPPAKPDVPEPLPPAAVTLQLASKPTGAEIFVGEERKAVGVTPVSTTLVMSSELVTLVAKFPDGSEVTQTVVPDRSLPEVMFVQRKPAVAITPTKPPTKASTQKPRTKKTGSSSSSQNRDDTMDPFKK
ncbi:MAG: protein kinase [Myxococcota bacterium]|nr:protein kinase [Myxococcota bacterium]